MYMVESATVDWVASLTINGGTVAYSAELRRLKPASASAVHDIQFQTAQRPTDEHAVTTAGAYWLPGTRTHTDYVPVTQVVLERNSIDGNGVVGALYNPADTAGNVGTISFGIDASNFYQAACTVEIRYGGSSSPWVAVQGTQIPTVPFYDVRISNGVTRATLTNNTPLQISGASQFLFENVVESGGVYSWNKYATAEIDGSAGGSGGPMSAVATPTILRNTPESVVLRYQVTYNDETFSYRNVSINRGDSFATVSGPPQNIQIWVNHGESPYSSDNAAMTGGRRSDVERNGYGWALMTTGVITRTIPTANKMSVNASSYLELIFAIGTYSSTVTVDADYEDLVSQWWLAAGYTQRAVSA
jgi:hypothetical protein